MSNIEQHEITDCDGMSVVVNSDGMYECTGSAPDLIQGLSDPEMTAAQLAYLIATASNVVDPFDYPELAAIWFST